MAQVSQTMLKIFGQGEIGDKVKGFDFSKASRLLT